MQIYNLKKPKINSILITFAILLLLATSAYPWGSLDEAPWANTHKYIDEKAFEVLKNSLFLHKNFPTKEAIISYEGINRAAEGRGPDAEGSTLYSEHYYNPRTGKGNAPQAVKKYFLNLAKSNIEKTREAGAKAAAWAAHFLADMFVPYHVVGMPAQEALERSGIKLVEELEVEFGKITPLQKMKILEMPFILTKDIAGDWDALGSGVVIGGTKENLKGNFTNEIILFAQSYKKAPHMDWFDPWYWNGWSITEDKTSTHIAWEYWAHPKLLSYYYRFIGFYKNFKNAYPSFDNPIERQANQVEEMAKLAAQETVDNTRDYINYPFKAINGAINAVVTLWRASYSALEPDFKVDYRNGKYFLVGAIRNNEKEESVNNVKLRIQVTHGKNQNIKELSIGDIERGANSNYIEEEISISPDFSGEVEIVVEVIGRYWIPDLQYAKQVIKETIRPVCKYDYSDWSKCDSKTKKQKRTVISKSPDGCVEREKPILERDCESEESDKVTDNGEMKNLKERLERAIKNKNWRELIEIQKEIEGKKPINTKFLEEVNRALRELSEETQKYLNQTERYLKELIEKDKIAYVELERGVKAYLKKEKCDKKLIEACWRECEKLENEKDKLTCRANCACEIPFGDYLRCIEQAQAEHSKRQKSLINDLDQLLESKPYRNYKEYVKINDYEGYFKAYEEIKTKLNLPDPIPSPVKLPWAYSSPCPAGATDADVSSEKLTISLKQYVPNPPLIPNRTVVVTAEVSGGKPPYDYSWSGSPQGKGKEVIYQFSKPGEHTITVEVTDSLGSKESANMKIKVLEDLKAQIRGLSKEHIYGTEVMIQVEIPHELSEQTKAEPLSEECRPGSPFDPCARVVIKKPPVSTKPERKSGDVIEVVCRECEAIGDLEKSVSKSFDRNVRFIFHSDKEGIEFNPGTSVDGKTRVSLKRMGKIKIWAEIQKQDTEKSFITIGETPQVEIEVKPPQFVWKFTPERGKAVVGQEIRASISTIPAESLRHIDFRWSSPESSNRMEYNKAASEIGFKLKDTKPLTLTVQPEVPFYRDPIGQPLKEEYQAQTYQVSITPPRYLGPKPRIWKCDTEFGGACPGLVEVEDTQFAVHRDIFLKAIVTPKPDSPRYLWSITPSGVCGIPGAGDEIRINCSQTGTYTVKVEVTNTEGIKLGEATQTVVISISDEILRQAERSSEAYQKLNEARNLRKQGKLDEALKLLEEARKLDSKNPQIQKLINEINQDKKTLAESIKKAKEAERVCKFDDAKRFAEEALKIEPNNQEAQAVLRKIEKDKKDIEKYINSIKSHLSKNEFSEAQGLVNIVGNINSYCPEVQSIEKELYEKMKQYEKEIKERFSAIDSAINIKDYDKAYELIKKVRDENLLSYRDRGILDEKERNVKNLIQQKNSTRESLKQVEKFYKAEEFGSAVRHYENNSKWLKEYWNPDDPEVKHYTEIYNDALRKSRRLAEIVTQIERINSRYYMSEQDRIKGYEEGVKLCEEASAIQESIKKWKDCKEEFERKVKETAKRIEEAQKRAKAESLRKEAYNAEHQYIHRTLALTQKPSTWTPELEQELEGLFRRAVEKYEESLKFEHDKEVEEKIKALKVQEQKRKELIKNYQRAVELKKEADRLISEAERELNHDLAISKLSEALQKLENSQKTYPLLQSHEFSNRIGRLQGLVKLRQVQKVSEEAQRIANAGKVNQAVSILEGALQELNKYPYSQFITYEERRPILEQIKSLKGKVEEAQRLKVQAQNQEKAGKIEEAIRLYEESLKLVFDEMISNHVNKLKERKSIADSLWQECTELARLNRLSEAVKKCEQSIGYLNREDRQRALVELKAAERKAKEEAERKAQADRLWDECVALTKANKLKEAQLKCEQSLSLWSSQERQQALSKLKAQIKQNEEENIRKIADRLWNECIELARQKQYEQAWQRCDESLKHWRNDQRVEATAKLREEAKRLSSPPVSEPPRREYTVQSPQTVDDQNKQIADRLWNECVELTKQRKLEAAWQKCDQSLKYWRNDQRIEATMKLKEEMEREKRREQVTPTPTTALNLTGKWTASCILLPEGRRQTFEVTINQNGDRFTAQAKDGDSYSGRINGNSISGTTQDGAKLTGTVLDQNRIHTEIDYGIHGYRHKCELTRVSVAQQPNTHPTQPPTAPQTTETPNTEQTRVIRINAIYRNLDRENVHIFIEGRDTFRPENRVTPNETKTVKLELPERATTLTFVAGRGGHILAKCRWDWVPDVSTTRIPVVSFAGPGLLSCTTSLGSASSSSQSTVPSQAQYSFTGKVTTTVQRMGNWQSEPLDGVEVFVGKDLWIESTPAGDFVRNAKNIVARTTTDSRGEFRLNIPPGRYTLVLWKRGFVPQFGPVSIPGSYNGNLKYGNPAGMYPHSSLGFKDN